MRAAFLRLLVLTLALLAGTSALRAAEPATVLAASSLEDVLTKAADAFHAAGHPRPVLAFASSAASARQLAAGAPADLILTADMEWMDWLAARGRINPASRRTVASGRLVIAGQPGQAWIGSRAALLDALDNRRLAVADPDSVPAGRYARAALTRMRAWPALSKRLAVAENVRAALALVERGAAPLAVVYETDLRVTDDAVLAGRFRAGSHPPILYPAARVAGSKSPEAGAFLAFLTSPRGQAIFRAYGFGVSPGRDAE